MKKKLIKIWNNRVFRTFLEAVVGSIAAFFVANNIFEIDSQTLIGMLISAIATGLSMVMPLIDDGDDEE